MKAPKRAETLASAGVIIKKAVRSLDKARRQIDHIAVRLKALELRQLYISQALLMDRWREPPNECVDLRLSEVKVFSQNGEDGIIAALVNGLEHVPENFVEFGVGGRRMQHPFSRRDPRLVGDILRAWRP